MENEKQLLEVKKNAYIDYVKKCESDSYLTSLIEKYKPIAKALDYDKEKDESFFEEYLQDSDMYYYSPVVYENYKYIYENWPKAKDEIEKQIQGVEKSIFIKDKKHKLDILNTQLHDVKFAYSSIKTSLEQEKIKQDILENKSESVQNLVDKIKGIEKYYATDIAKKYSKEYPELYKVDTEVEKNEVVVENQQNYYSSEVLDKAFTDVQQNTLENNEQSM